MRNWKWILAIAIILLALAGLAAAMRLNIGASQVSRLDIGAAQESLKAGSVFGSPVFNSKVFGD